jgi:hypothetical protein
MGKGRLKDGFSPALFGRLEVEVEVSITPSGEPWGILAFF